MHRRAGRFRFFLRWATLALVGWLAYALLRACWVAIYVGMPVYDWAWYLPVTLLLVGLPIYTTWGLPRLKVASVVLAGLLGIVVIAFNGFGQAIYLWPGRSPPAPISFWAYSDFRDTPETILRDIQAAGGYIYYGPGSAPIEGERAQALAAKLRRLGEYNIQVYLVPPIADFLSTPVRREWLARARSAADFIRRENLSNVIGIIGDIELPVNRPLDILWTDQTEFALTVQELRAGVNAIRQEHPNLQIGITATWAHYLDMLDGDSDLSLVMRSPMDPPGGWDFTNSMSYSSFFPPDWRAYYVYQTELAIAKRYPPGQVTHLVGLVGGGTPPRLLDFDDLVRDARLSRAMGVREIVVYRLDGSLEAFGDDFIRRLTVAVNGPQPETALVVPFSRQASLVFYGVVAADALLDIRGRWGCLWLVWAMASGLIVRHTTTHLSKRTNR